jgi:hypothetical protein
MVETKPFWFFGCWITRKAITSGTYTPRRTDLPSLIAEAKSDKPMTDEFVDELPIVDVAGMGSAVTGMLACACENGKILASKTTVSVNIFTIRLKSETILSLSDKGLTKIWVNRLE